MFSLPKGVLAGFRGQWPVMNLPWLDLLEVSKILPIGFIIF
jgi:hypothetical protein